MTPERMARLVTRWVRLYTWRLPEEAGRRRREEIAADLHDHVAHEREQGVAERRIAAGIGSRLLRGLPADAAWRFSLASARSAYQVALALALATAWMLFWLVGAVGVVGAEGDDFDRFYAGVLAVGLAGALLARFRAAGMAWALAAMALVHAGIGVAAFAEGKHEAPATSAAELGGLTLMFVVLFGGAAWLFRQAARKRAQPLGR